MYVYTALIVSVSHIYKLTAVSETTGALGTLAQSFIHFSATD